MWIASFIAAFRAWSRYRSTVRELSMLDNRMLQDIGLDRSEIESRAWRAVQG